MRPSGLPDRSLDTGLSALEVVSKFCMPGGC